MKPLKLVKKLVMISIMPIPPLRRLVLKVVNGVRSLLYKRTMRKFPTEPKTVIFETFSGRSYSDNPRAIYEAMLADERFSDYKFIWVFNDARIDSAGKLRNIGGIREKTFQRASIVRYGTREYYESYARAGVWVANARIRACLKPKADQKYIQTWHGSALKKLGYDIEVESRKTISSNCDLRKLNDDDACRYFAMVSPSPFMTAVYKSSFNLAEVNPQCQIWETGYPRNDRLINYDKAEVAGIKKRLGLPSDKKVILYAPTWRDDQYKSDGHYFYEPHIDFVKLQAKFGDSHIVLFRAHYLVENKADFPEFDGFVRNVSKANDINDLYLVADILITDYSSTFFDFANLHRPIIFYMDDLKHYQNDLHGFYLSLDELPGPIATDMNDLQQHIENPPGITAKYLDFVKKYAPLDDGTASEKVLEKIL